MMATSSQAEGGIREGKQISLGLAQKSNQLIRLLIGFPSNTSPNGSAVQRAFASMGKQVKLLN